MFRYSVNLTWSEEDGIPLPEPFTLKLGDFIPICFSEEDGIPLPEPFTLQKAA